MLVYLLFFPSTLAQINCENFFDNGTYQVPSIPLDCPENICYMSTIQVPQHGKWLIGGCGICQGKEGTHTVAKVWRGDFEEQYSYELPPGVDSVSLQIKCCTRNQCNASASLSIMISLLFILGIHVLFE